MIKTALIGQGYWGTKLRQTLESIQDCNLLQTIDVKNNQSIFDLHNDVEAVVIATPAQDHINQILHALDKNLHVYVEKPICMNSQECKLISKKVNNDKTLMTGHILLFNQCVDYIKSTVDFDQVKSININRQNWGRFQKHITPISSFAPHDIAMLDYWLNGLEPHAVAVNDIKVINKNVPDIQIINFKHKDININIKYTWLSVAKNRTVDIFSPDGCVLFDDMTKTVTTNKNYFQEERFMYEPEQSVKHFDHEPLIDEMQHFFDCIQNNITCKTGFAHAQRITEIVDILNDQS